MPLQGLQMEEPLPSGGLAAAAAAEAVQELRARCACCRLAC